jgi:Family of unknown function (DUF5681)
LASRRSTPATARGAGEAAGAVGWPEHPSRRSPIGIPQRWLPTHCGNRCKRRRSSSRPRTAQTERDYAVNYGKPALHTHLKKGQSGNPRGRPAKNSEPVYVTSDGKQRKIAKREAIVAQLINKSAGVDLHATKMLIEDIEQKAGTALPPEPRSLPRRTRRRRPRKDRPSAGMLHGEAYNTLLQRDFATFALRCFPELNPRTA